MDAGQTKQASAAFFLHSNVSTHLDYQTNHSLDLLNWLMEHDKLKWLLEAYYGIIICKWMKI